MKVLSFEGASVSASVCLTDGEQLLAQSFQNRGLTHSRTLLPMAQALLDNSGIALSEIDAFAIANGPGSFTGVRIGIATVKALAFGVDRPCIGVSTLEAMAWSACALGGELCCVMDARAGQVYNARFLIEHHAPRRLCADRVITLTALSKEIQSCPQFLVGDGAELCYNSIKNECTAIALAPLALRYPTGYGVALAALPRLMAGQGVAAMQLDAAYLRKPQAEREREKRLVAAQEEQKSKE